MENIAWEIIFFYMCLGVALLIEVRCIIKNIRAKKWVRTTGKIEESSIYTYSQSEYVYWVSGEQIKSQQVAFAIFTVSRSLEKIIKWVYTPAGEVTVYYNPNNVKESILAPGIRFFHFLDISVIIGFVLLFTHLFFS